MTVPYLYNLRWLTVQYGTLYSRQTVYGICSQVLVCTANFWEEAPHAYILLQVHNNKLGDNGECLAAPSSWMLNKLSSTYAPRPTPRSTPAPRIYPLSQYFSETGSSTPSQPVKSLQT
jgi:hypothetical protein